MNQGPERGILFRSVEDIFRRRNLNQEEALNGQAMMVYMISIHTKYPGIFRFLFPRFPDVTVDEHGSFFRAWFDRGEGVVMHRPPPGAPIVRGQIERRQMFHCVRCYEAFLWSRDRDAHLLNCPN